MSEQQQMGELIPVADFGTDQSDVVPVQIMRPGTFTEMHGREVEITEDDLDEYVANFEAGAAGQELPVFKGHPSAAVRAGEPAAAWFKRLYTKTIDGLKTLWADIQLTELGRELLEGGLFKYLSPTIEMDSKLIRGGGFVNLPAIKGQPAIEMSQFLQEVEDPTLMERMGKALHYFMEWVEGRKLEALQEGGGAEDHSDPEHTEGGEDMAMTDGQMVELREQIRSELEADFAQRQREIADLTESIRKEEREKVEAEMAERHALEADLAEFAGEVCSGDAGLSTPQEEIVTFLAGLDGEHRDQAKALLKAKVVDFSEHGHTGGGTQKDKLPEAMEAALRQHLAGRTEDIPGAVALFCEANAIKAEEFDLGEFLPKE